MVPRYYYLLRHLVQLKKNERGCICFLADFILTDEQRRDMTLEEQLKDLQEKLDMTQAIKHGGNL